MNNLGCLTRNFCALTLAIGVLANLSGCVALVGGAMVGAAMVTSDRRTVGTQAEDASIELKSANRISSMFGNEARVNVNSYNRKVLLTGEVKDEPSKERIVQLVKGVENVHSVVDEIQVSEFLTGLSARSSDALLTTKVKSKLVGTPDIYSSSFKVVTENGVVYLMGRVSQREAETATEAVREVAGVQKVVKLFDYIDEGELSKGVSESTEAEN